MWSALLEFFGFSYDLSSNVYVVNAGDVVIQL